MILKSFVGKFWSYSLLKLTNFKSRFWTRDTCHVGSEGTRWKLGSSEKQHILFHPEDATLNQRSEFFSKCWHKDKHLLANN